MSRPLADRARLALSVAAAGRLALSVAAVGRLALSVAAVAVATATAAAPAVAGLGEVSVFARVPAPGYPANALLGRDGLVYVGTFKPFSGGTAGAGSRIFSFAPDGSLVRSYPVEGQDPNAVDGVIVGATDRAGRLYLFDQAPARVVILDPRDGSERTWATFATLSGSPNPPEPDFGAWGPDGALYVTDYSQYVVWRIPPGGGPAAVWLSDPALNGTVVGPAGLRLEAGMRSFLLSTGAGGGANLSTGKLYRVPIGPRGRPGTLDQLWESAPAQAPDGFAIARSGNVYLSLVGPLGNAVVELSPAGALLARVPQSPAAQPQPIPFDAPGSVTFDGTDILVGNQSAINGTAANMAILRVATGEGGLAEHLPPLAAGQRLPRLAVALEPRRLRAMRRYVLRVTVSGPSGRRLRGALVTLGTLRARTDAAGRARLRVRFERAGVRTVVVRAPGYLRGRARLTVVGSPRRRAARAAVR